MKEEDTAADAISYSVYRSYAHAAGALTVASILVVYPASRS